MKTLKETSVKRRLKSSKRLEDEILTLKDKLSKAEETIVNLQRYISDAKLEKVNRKVNEILSSIDDDFYVLDCEWRFVYVSKKFTSKFGKEPADFIGKDYWQLFPESIGTIYEEKFRFTMMKREISRFESPCLYTDAYYKVAIFPCAEGITILATDITERRRAEEAFIEAKKQKEYLLNLSDALRQLSNPSEIKKAALRVLGENLQVTRSGYVEVLPDDETCIAVEECSIYGAPVKGFFRLSDYGPTVVPSLRSGKTIIENDILLNPELSTLEIEAYQKLSVRSQIVVPLVKNERLCAILGVNHSEAREWKPSEILIVEETAERTWAAAARGRAEQKLIESRKRLEEELADSKQLQLISSQLIIENNIHRLYEQIVDSSISIMDSDMGSLQMLQPGKNQLHLLAYKGFDEESAKFWTLIDEESASACRLALIEKRRIIVPDIDTCNFMSNTIDYEHYKLSGIKAVQSTPLITRSGQIIGTISNHWRKIHQPSERELNLLDVLARQAADLIDRKLAEEAVYQVKDNYQTVLDAIQEPIYLFNEQGIIVYANKTAARNFNMTPEEIAGHHFSDILPDDIVTTRIAQFDSVFQSGEIVHFEDEHEGTIFEHSFFPFFKNNKVEYVAAYSHDITQRKKAEEELFRLNEDLKRTEEKLDFALESGNIGVWEWNMETGELVADKRINQLLGFDIKLINKRSNSFRKFVHEEDLPHVEQAFKKAIEKGTPIDTISRIKSENNEIKYLNLKARITKRNGIPVSMIGVCIDITEMQKSAESALFRVNEELLRSNKELQQFAYVASHDLQEPLRMISSFTQLLEQRYGEKLDKDANDFIRFAVEGSKRMQRLINDLLSFSRIQTKAKEFNQTNMNIVLEKAIANISVKINETKAEITSDQLPVINADDNQMVQVFQNLIVNSIKFNLKTPVIHISYKEEPSRHIFAISDNGIGIEEQYFDKIFNIFQRLSVNEEHEGTGIGLAICKRIIERHGGQIWVESEPDKGSTFYFSILKRLA